MGKLGWLLIDKTMYQPYKCKPVERTPIEATSIPQVEYPRAMSPMPGYRQGTDYGTHTMPCCPSADPTWSYPYTWNSGTLNPGTVTSTYGLDYQHNHYRAASSLAQMANMRQTHIEDVISSTTLMPPSGPLGTDATLRLPSTRTTWDNNYPGPPPNVTIQQKDDASPHNVLLDVTLLSPEAHELTIGEEPRISRYAAQKLKIRPFRTLSVQTDIYWEFPDHTYGEIKASGREKFCTKGIEVTVQKISNVPLDGISVLLHNTTDKMYNVNIKDEIGEIIILQVLQPIVRSQFKTELGKKEKLVKGQ